MATPSQRRLQPTRVRNFGSGLKSPLELPSLTDLQTESYRRFLQEDSPSDKRKNSGLEGVLREVFRLRVSINRFRWNICVTSWVSAIHPR